MHWAAPPWPRRTKGKACNAKTCLQPSSRPSENLKGGEIKNIGKEKEDGIEQYEVESVLNGKSRDFNVDVKGNLVLLEVATTIDAIPATAMASILKKVSDGKLAAIETFTKTGQPMMYEASYIDKKGKKHEVLVKADGTQTKE